MRDRLGRAWVRGGKLAVQALLWRRFRAAGARVYRADGSEAAYSPHLILGLGMMELEFPRDWPPQFRMIGPVTASPEGVAPDPAVFAGPEPRVLVTLGTHLPWAKAGLVGRLAPLFAAFPTVHFAISLGRWDRTAAQPLERGANWTVHSFVSYDPHLSRFRAVIHHGGSGITFGCIRAGIPALVCPHDYDQFDWAARIEHHGAGRRVKSLTGSDTVDALRDLLSGRWAARLATLQAAALRYDPGAALLEAIEAIA